MIAYSFNSIKKAKRLQRLQGISLIETLVSVVLFSFTISVSLAALEKLTRQSRWHLVDHNRVTQLEELNAQLQSHALYQPLMNDFKSGYQTKPSWTQYIPLESYSATINSESYYYLD